MSIGNQGNNRNADLENAANAGAAGQAIDFLLSSSGQAALA